MRKAIIGFLILFVIISIGFSMNCFVYFEGIGCPHCARVDSKLFNEYLSDHDTLIIEYEIYKHKGNSEILSKYVHKYFGVNGVPQIFLGNGKSYAGDIEILNSLDKLHSNTCLLLSGPVQISNLNYSDLYGARLWYKDKVVIVGKKSISHSIVSNFLFNNITPKGVSIGGHSVEYSRGHAYFANGVNYDGWIFLWGRTTKWEPPIGYNINNLLVGIVLFVLSIVVIYFVLKRGSK